MPPIAWGSSDSDIWAASSDLLHWDGKGWTSSALPKGFAGARALSGSGPKDVWMLNDHPDRQLFHYDGQQWSAAGLSPLDDAMLVYYWPVLWSPAPGQLWVSGTDFVSKVGALVRGDGTSWTPMTVPEAGALWGTSATDVWLGGWGGTYHWDGTAWTTFPLAGIYRIKGTGASDVMLWQKYAGTEFPYGQRLMRWDGSTWTPQFEAQGIQAVCGSSQAWWAVSSSPAGEQLRQRRGGVWSTAPLAAAWSFTNSCYASEDGTLRLFGWGGAILRREPTP